MAEDQKQNTRLSTLEEALGGKYKIIERIGVGGFGEVYLGEHTQLRRKVAIKLLSHTLAGQEDVVKRFQREARAAATLSHPNIIDIYDVGESGDIYYFVMKYIDGETLSERMHREQNIPPAEAIHIIRQVADALAYAHEHDIVHRDIKPANVMLDEYGKPVLMDFGVARVQFEGNLTKTGTLMGTPHYLPPELPLGKKVDGRSDIYSLGIMFYEMLSGKPPFHDENSVALIFKHINETPQNLKELSPELSDQLCEVVHKMIEKLPEKRYQTADQVVEALQELASAYPAPTPQAVRRSTPGVTRNTEKLLLLAHEHVQQHKFSKAIELYATLTKRDPNNETAKKHIAELIDKLMDKVQQHISQNDFGNARDLLHQARTIAFQNERFIRLTEEIERAEEDFQQQREKEFKVHYDAAQVALQTNNATGIIEHLTKASTINSSSPELQELIHQAQTRITDEINLLCEKLDFDTAGMVLDMGRKTFPDLGETKSASVERHRELYKKLNGARDLLLQEKWREAEKEFQEFLNAQPPYDFEVFHSLRTEAEESLKKIRQNLGKPTPAPTITFAEAAQALSAKAVSESKPQTLTPSAPAPPGPVAQVAPAAKPAEAAGAAGAPARATAAPKVRRRPVLMIAGAGVIVLLISLIAIRMMHRQPQTTGSATDVSLLHQLAESKLKQDEAGKPTAGELLITSTPEGAKVFVGNEEKGVTPLKLSDLAFGKYALKMQLKGYKDVQQEVELTEEKASLEIPAILEAIIPVVGALVVESKPSGAVILIGSKVAGVTPKTFQNVNAGKYTVTLKLDGFHDYIAPIRIKDKETTTVTAQMEEIPKPVVQEQPKEPEIHPGMLVPLGPDVTAPKAIKKTSARYPDAAKEKKLGGTVRLEALISETGKVMEVKVVQSAHPLLDEAAVKSVKEWIWEPAKKKGVVVKVWVPVSMSFVQR